MSSTPIPNVLDDLKRQHQWVEDQKKRGDEAFSLVSPEAFLRGIRDLGYRSTLTALDELVDNSVQANAQNVWVFPAYLPTNKAQRKPDSIVVVDDGHGMEPDMIRIAVRWGGTHRENDRSGFGRYGFGLPSSCVSIGERYTIYSKVDGGGWHAVTIDVKEVSTAIAKAQKVDAKVRKEKPPAYVMEKVDATKFTSGTVVIIEKLDRLDAGFKTTEAFTRNLMEHMGVQYRKMMSQVKFFVKDGLVQAVDPLFLDENGRWFDETPIHAEAVEPKEFIVTTPKGDIGTVRLRASAFPFNFHLKDPDGEVRPVNHNSRYRIMRAYNGINVCRAGRQIDCVMRLPWTTFVNYDRFWAIEIDFDPILDEFFGITTNKQQIVFSESVIDHLKVNGLTDLIKDLRVRMKKSKATVLAALGKQQKKPLASEQTMNNILNRKPRKVDPTPEQVKKADENLTAQAKKRAEITGEPVAEAKQKVEAEAKERPFKVTFESMPDGPVYRPERLSTQYRLIVNTSHRFYTDIYEPAQNVPTLRPKLETLLFVLGEAELDATGEREKFYKAERVYGSQRLNEALADLDEAGDVEDEASANMEQQENEEPTPAAAEA